MRNSIPEKTARWRAPPCWRRPTESWSSSAFAFASVSAFTCAALFACGHGVTEPSDGGGERIVLFARGLTLAVGDTTTLGLYWLSNNRVIEQSAATGGLASWSFSPATTLQSRDTSVAKFGSGGLVIAGGPGSTWLHAQRGSAEDSSRVTVTVAPTEATGVVAVATGSGHTCALDHDGAAWCWGDLWNAATGSGFRARYSRLVSPTRVDTHERFVQIDVGTDHSCALSPSGAVFCWGDNRFGQIGTTNALEASPQRIVGIAEARALSVGGDGACVVRTDGAIQCWGVEFSTATVYSTGTSEIFDAVSVGSHHVCARSSNRDVWCWGANTYGQLGTGSAEPRASPTRVGLGVKITQVTSGSDYTCALAENGNAWCWGLGLLGELGQGDVSQLLTPGRVTSAVAFTALSAGGGHTCALDRTGAAYCWGGNLYGGLGIGPSTKVDPTAVDFMFRLPMRVTGQDTYSAIAVGGGTTCAIERVVSRLDCWGANTNGQLGIGQVGWSSGRKYSTRNVPSRVIGFTP